MAGMGPPPKDPKMRQRRNKTTSAATLILPVPDPPASGDDPPASGDKKHELPHRSPDQTPWHPETKRFWDEVWASPMAAEFIDADVPGLIILARLVDRFNYGAVELAAEIRLQRQCFGLTPLDRRRLQWEIEKVSDAQARAARRKGSATPDLSQPNASRDPRRNLRAVK